LETGKNPDKNGIRAIGHFPKGTPQRRLHEVLVVASLLLLFFREPHHPVVMGKVSILNSFEPLKSTKMRRWLLLINLCLIGDSMIITMVRPMLVDKGLSLDTIGLMLGTIRPLFATLDAVLCSSVINFFSRRTNLITFNIANAMMLALFILPALNMTNDGFLYILTLSFVAFVIVIVF
jgi:hypothetical protein